MTPFAFKLKTQMTQLISPRNPDREAATQKAHWLMLDTLWRCKISPAVSEQLQRQLMCTIRKK